MATAETRALVSEAVYGHQDSPKTSILDRLFARVFSGLVYTQIWEDPFIDLEAMALEPHHRVVTISSAGCNALNYLTANPGKIDVVDLNGAHLSLLELKTTALASAEDYAVFERFFAQAASRDNVSLYDTVLRWQMSTSARIYWNGKAAGKRRIEMFANGFYRNGLLGQFIRFMRFYAKLHGVQLSDWAGCKTVEEQKAWFDAAAPRLFNGRLVQLICRSPVVLYQLGIPPRQFHELCDGKPENMAQVLRERARALLTTGSVDENYFAWQATHCAYREAGPYPPYLRRENFDTIRSRVDRITLHQTGVRQHLQTLPEQSVDRVVLLDAQDWMDRAEVARLWTEITRTARPGARVIFRTAGEIWRAYDALPADIAARWQTDDAVNAEMTRRDMSGIYGRFHLYQLKDPA